MHTLFAMQVVLPLVPTAELRQQIRQLLREAPEHETYAGKGRFYAALVRALAPLSAHFVSGVWDYVEDPARAEAEFRSWSEGTATDAAEEAGARQEGPGGYMFVTLLFLLRRGGASDQMICELCRMPEGQQWRRETFVRLLHGMQQLNFASVREDAVYMRPGLGEAGIAEATLAAEHYQHLRPLS